VTSRGELWRRSGAGDADAFGELFRQSARPLYNHLFRTTGNWAIAEDLLSIVFLEAWRRRDVELADDMVLPFLYGIAVNVARNQRRALRRFDAALRRVPVACASPSQTADADARLDDERDFAAALRLVRRLPRTEREVFLLCAWSDLSYADAASALGIPVGTVRSRLSRARARLDRLHASDPAGTGRLNPVEGAP
jgi:RNA polymerase sigma factor (sigma-70 family)